MKASLAAVLLLLLLILPDTREDDERQRQTYVRVLRLMELLHTTRVRVLYGCCLVLFGIFGSLLLVYSCKTFRREGGERRSKVITLVLRTLLLVAVGRSAKVRKKDI